MTDPKSTAVVLIEYQNDFMPSGGALHEAVNDVMPATSAEEQRAPVEMNCPLCSRPLTHGEFLRELPQQPAGASATGP